MPDPAVLACTVVARQELPAARVLARSYLDHHPGHEFVVLVLDQSPDQEAHPDPGPGMRVVGPDWLDGADLDPVDFLRLATAYPQADLPGAVLPHALLAALDRARVAVFLAATGQVVAALPDLAGPAQEHDIVLVPQLLEPLPQDGRQPDAGHMPPGAPFSLGLLAVGQGARPFLAEWTRWSRHQAPVTGEPRPDAAPHPVSQVPGRYRHTVLRDPGCDIGYWNAHERTDATPRFVNFRGYRSKTPWLLSADCPTRPRVLLSQHEALRVRCAEYLTALAEAANDKDDKDEYGFGALPDGRALTPTMRRLFRHTWAAAERPDPEPIPVPVPPHAFDGDTFADWVRAPGSTKARAAGLNRIADWTWQNRPDLQVVFRHPYREDATAFRDWCRDHGVAEGLIPDWALPSGPEPVARPSGEFGVNLAGYLTGELGLGEMGRVLHRTLLAANIPVASLVEEESLTCRTDLAEPSDTGQPRFPVSVLAVNADYTRMMLETYPALGDHRYRIGLWAWELEDFPAWQHDAFALVDEVWVVSRFCRATIGAHSPVPVKVFPVPVPDPGAPARTTHTPGQPVRFLFVFDFNSTGQRKNATGLVTAFQRAFGTRDDVRLVIKATNGDLHPSEAERLRLLVHGDRRIELIERYLSVAELNALYLDSHAYVSLHRSEGFGLTVAEAMIRGLPVVCTNYGGTAEFIDDTVGWLIPYRMVEVGEGAQPYHASALWAEPDLDAAATAMREIADNPSEAERRGKAAREHLLHTRSMAVAANWVRTELTAAHRTWRQLPKQDSPLRRTARAGVRRLRRLRPR